MRPRPLKIVWIGAAFLASFFVATAVLPKLPLRAKPYPRLLRMPHFDVPGDDAFFVYSVSDELSQMVLYHDL